MGVGCSSGQLMLCSVCTYRLWQASICCVRHSAVPMNPSTVLLSSMASILSSTRSSMQLTVSRECDRAVWRGGFCTVLAMNWVSYWRMEGQQTVGLFSRKGLARTRISLSEARFIPNRNQCSMGYRMMQPGMTFIMPHSYLTTNPSLVKKTSHNSTHFAPSTTALHPSHPQDMQRLTEAFMAREQQRIRELEMQIAMYQVKCKEEEKAKADPLPVVEQLQLEVEDIRKEEESILGQIQQCKMVENSVTPVEYYLWKKKQRISTYDVSVAALCADVEQQRTQLQQSIELHRKEQEQLTSDIQELEEILQAVGSSGEIPQAPPSEPPSPTQDHSQLFAENTLLREEYNPLASEIEILQENKDIVCMQVMDNVESVQGALRAYYEGEKVRMAREFKQLQLEARGSEVSALNKDEQAYSVEPLLGDYAYKLRQLHNTAPEEVRRLVVGLMQPLPWEKVDYRQLVEVDARSEHVYQEYRRLQNEYIQNESENERLESEVKRITAEIAVEQQKSNDISINIQKMKTKLHSR